MKRVPVTPGHPALRVGGQFVGVFVEFRQIVEGVDAVQFAGVDQAHKQIAYTGPVPGFIEVGILAMENRLLEGSFTHIVI